jgi:hypothetical protein
MIMRAGCAAARGDFICSFLVRSLSAAGFICHMESPILMGAVYAFARGDFISYYILLCNDLIKNWIL